MIGLGLRILVLALLTLGASAASAAAQAGCTPVFASQGAVFSSQLCGMPDYDQRRTAATLTGDGRSINLQTIAAGPITLPLALQGDGGCHCVPTSFVNLLGYYAGKGVSGLFPPVYDWEGRAGYAPRPDVAPGQYLNGQSYPDSEVAAYNRTTFAIKRLGLDVVATSDTCGTTWDTVLKYHKEAQALFPKVQLATFTIKPNGNLAPKILANLLAMGATAGVSYGRVGNWRKSATSETYFWEGTGGGHAITVRGISSQGNGEAKIRISDPARNNDPAEKNAEGNFADTDRFRQSVPTTHEATLYRHTRGLPDGTTEVRWRWGDVSSDNKTRIWNSILVALPVSAVMTNGNGIQYLPGFAFNRTGTPPGELKPKAFDVGGPVMDAALLVSTGEIAYIRKGDDKVRAIGVGTRETRVIGPAPKGATALEPDPTGGRIFVAGTSKIVQLDPEGPVVQEIPVRSPVRALAYDPGSGLDDGRLIAVGADRGLQRLQPDSLGRVGAVQRLPRSIFEGSGPLAAAVDAKGQLYVRRGSARTVGRVGLANRKVGRGSLSALGGSGGLQLSDRGTLFSVVAGRLVELTPGGKVAPNSALNGRATRGRVLQVLRSGSQFSPAEGNQLIDERVNDPFFPEMAR